MSNEEIRKEAYKDYSDGMRYKDIAEKYGVSLSAVKSWATRYWKKGCNQSEKKLQPQNKEVATSQKENMRETVQAINNSDLSDKHQLFCLFYVKSFNATRAYQKVYGCSYQTALTNGPALLRNTRIRNEIQRLKEERFKDQFFDEHDIFQWYLDIATASITDYVSFGREEVQVSNMFGPVFDEKTGKPVMREINYVKFKESDEVDGRIIKKVKMGKDGASIELYDSMKAMEWLAEHMSMGTQEQQTLAQSIQNAYEKHSIAPPQLQQEDKDEP